MHVKKAAPEKQTDCSAEALGRAADLLPLGTRVGVGKSLGPRPRRATPSSSDRTAVNGGPSAALTGPHASFPLPAATSAAAHSPTELSEAAAAPRPEAGVDKEGPLADPAARKERPAATRPRRPGQAQSPLLLTTARAPRPGFPLSPDHGLTRILRLISVPISMTPRRAAGSVLRSDSIARSSTAAAARSA